MWLILQTGEGTGCNRYQKHQNNQSTGKYSALDLNSGLIIGALSDRIKPFGLVPILRLDHKALYGRHLPACGRGYHYAPSDVTKLIDCPGSLKTVITYIPVFITHQTILLHRLVP